MRPCEHLWLPSIGRIGWWTLRCDHCHERRKVARWWSWRLDGNAEHLYDLAVERKVITTEERPYGL